MNNKYSKKARCGVLQSLQQWFCSLGVKEFCVIAVFAVGLFGYVLLYATDAYSAYVDQRASHSLVIQEQQFAALLRQVEQLEVDVRQQQEHLSKTYHRVLNREGRLSENHIVSMEASRLVGEPNAISEEVSRSHSRYSPYQFDITLPSAVTAYELEQALAHTGLKGLGRSFVKAELIYGINAMFLTALAIHESHWGNSPLAKDKHNLFGFGAYDADPYHYADEFPSKSECIMTVTRFIREQYIEGQLSRGRSIAAVNHKYASDASWSEKVVTLMLQLDEMIRQQSDGRPPDGAAAHLLR
jgi:beta-N-acetylglucosaminidase